MAGRSGFTVVEALVAVSVLGILLAAVVPAFLSYLRVNTGSELRSQAVVAAQTVLDDIGGARGGPGGPFAGESRDSETREVVVGGRSFEVRVERERYCEGEGACHDDARRVRLEVMQDGRTRYAVATVFTRLD